jgi:histidyl-tRNA synthetase
MRDLLPDAMVRFRRLKQVFRDACQAWGYNEVRTPTIEYLHLFTGSGALPAQMLNRVYSFLDWDGWSGERVVLRPDATIPTVRLYLEQLSHLQLAKLFYVQNVFRYADSDQPREMWQCGVELIGDSQPVGDIELVLLMRQVLNSLDIGPVQIQLSHPGVIRAILSRAGLSPQEQQQVYEKILIGDLSDITSLEDTSPELSISLRLLFGLDGNGRQYLANLQSVITPVVSEASGPLAELMAIAQVLDDMGCPYRVGAGAIGPFEYYTGPAFQFEIDGVKVGGGGRYDHLIEMVGGKRMPATGCALNVEAILPLMEDAGVQHAAITIVASDSPSEITTALRAAQALREVGLTVSVSGTPTENGRWELRSLSAQAGAFLLRDTYEMSEHDCRTLEAVISLVKGEGL